MITEKNLKILASATDSIVLAVTKLEGEVDRIRLTKVESDFLNLSLDFLRRSESLINKLRGL